MTLEEAARNYAECLKRLDEAEREAKATAEDAAEAGRVWGDAQRAAFAAQDELLRSVPGHKRP